MIFSCGSFSFPAFVRDPSLNEFLYGTFKQSLSPGKALCPKVCSATCPPGTGRHQPPIVFCRKLCQPQNSGGFQGEAPSLSPPKDPVNSSSPPQVGDSPSQLGIPVLLMDLAAGRGSRLSCACLHPVITCCRVRRSWGFYFCFIKLESKSGFSSASVSPLDVGRISDKEAQV